MNTNNTFFENKSSCIYTVRLLWNIGQPFVCGTLEEIVKYALKPNNGIDFFAEIHNYKIKKVSKKELKNMLICQGFESLSKELFSKY